MKEKEFSPVRLNDSVESEKNVEKECEAKNKQMLFNLHILLEDLHESNNYQA